MFDARQVLKENTIQKTQHWIFKRLGINSVGQTDQLARFTARFTKPFETDHIDNLVESLGLTLKLH